MTKFIIKLKLVWQLPQRRTHPQANRPSHQETRHRSQHRRATPQGISLQARVFGKKKPE